MLKQDEIPDLDRPGNVRDAEIAALEIMETYTNSNHALNRATTRAWAAFNSPEGMDVPERPSALA